MNIEQLREFCISLHAVTEDIKWGDNLVFSVAGKIFCVADLKPPMQVTFKVPEDEFPGITATKGFVQAPCFARMKWVLVQDESLLGDEEWEHYLRQSYELVKAGLPKKTRDRIG
jgi:predicted DNA-binding protein (MmcQ/YjbR family)